MARKPIDFAKAKQDTTGPALEAMAHLYKALLAIPPFKLLDGTPVRVEAYTPPEVNDAGEAECGVDVKLPGGHLEFMLKNTGWGKSFVNELASKHASKQGRQR